MRLAFDIEADGLNRSVTKIHCIVAQDLDTGEVHRFGPTEIEGGLDLLSEALELWGHNITYYDIPVLREVYPEFPPIQAQCFDTLILSRMFYPDMLDKDFRMRPANMPANLYGRHSLEAWGYRLGVLKSEFGKSLAGDWSTYTPEMLDYCAQDVGVSVALAKVFTPAAGKYAKAVRLEHDVATWMVTQEYNGFPFRVDDAIALMGRLREELEKLSDEMRSTFTFVDGGEWTPARDNKGLGYVKGCPCCKIKEFNPTSRDHIVWAFKTHRGWTPTDFTKKGKPIIDETVLNAIGTEEAQKFGRILELQKHLGMLSEGTNSWLKQVKDGRIHHNCSMNTATSRMAHLRPNLAQVPSGHEFRALFHPGPGRVMVGCDASGLELRCLAHYLARYDGGKFGEEVVHGDIHQTMADISGVDRRTQKTITYALIYGAGDTKLGLSAGASKKDASRRGKELRQKLLTGVEGFDKLMEAVTSRASSGKVSGLDGRPIKIQKPHAALNYLLQSAGAIITKTWLLLAYERMSKEGLDFQPLAYVHDEVQLSVAPGDAQRVRGILEAAMPEAGRLLGVRCPLAAESGEGSSWADTH